MKLAARERIWMIQRWAEVTRGHRGIHSNNNNYYYNDDDSNNTNNNINNNSGTGTKS